MDAYEQRCLENAISECAANLSAQQRKPVVRAALTRFESRIKKYIAQLKATGQADVAHLLRRDVDCLRAALNGGHHD